MRGGTAHRVYSVVVFVILASLDNVAIGLVPALYGSMGGSVSCAVVSDLISPKRRGLVMSFWGLAQGVGTLAGTMVGGLLGHADWREPFLVAGSAGVVATVAYLFTYNVPRGESQPELAGVEYDERI